MFDFPTQRRWFETPLIDVGSWGVETLIHVPHPLGVKPLAHPPVWVCAERWEIGGNLAFAVGDELSFNTFSMDRGRSLVVWDADENHLHVFHTYESNQEIFAYVRRFPGEPTQEVEISIVPNDLTRFRLKFFLESWHNYNA